LNVICVERLSENRLARYHSICGECISEKGSKIIKLHNDEIRNKISEFRVDWPGGKITRVKMNGFIIDRVKVIERLRKGAETNGATFINSSATNIAKLDSGYEITLRSGKSFVAKYVLGADGAFSTVRKQLFHNKPDKIIPVEMRVLDKQPENPNSICFKLKGKGKYYSWDFPYGSGSSVGAIRGCLDSSEGVHGARFIPIGYPDVIAKDNAALIGDAAGLVNPLSFGGLRIAFDSAKHASDAIVKGDLSQYQRWWDKSPLSDKRFMKLSKTFAGYDD